MNRNDFKQKLELDASKDIVCGAKGYSHFYPITTFNKFSNASLYSMALNEEALLSKSQREIKALFTEICKRTFKSLNTPMKKIKIEQGPKYLEDGRLYDAQIDFATSKNMVFTTYSLPYYKKLQEDYDFDNYLYVIFHESKHAEQFYNFKHLDKNSNTYPRNLFMRNEQIMRFYLSDDSHKHLIPKDDYEFDSLERDADYFAIMSIISKMKSFENGGIENIIPANKKNLEHIIPKMLDFTAEKNGKNAPTLQLENFMKLFVGFKNSLSPEVYSKFAKEINLDDPIIFDIFKDSLEKRDQNVKDSLYWTLSIYNQIVKNAGKASLSEEEFNSLCQKEGYEFVFDKLSETLNQPSNSVQSKKEEPVSQEQEMI